MPLHRGNPTRNVSNLNCLDAAICRSSHGFHTKPNLSDALMVVATDLGRQTNDAGQRRVGIDHDLVLKVAVRLVHVLFKLATSGDREHLHTAADREQWRTRFDRPAGNSEVEGVLLNINVVYVLALNLSAVRTGVKIASPGQQHPVHE